MAGSVNLDSTYRSFFPFYRFVDLTEFLYDGKHCQYSKPMSKEQR